MLQVSNSFSNLGLGWPRVLHFSGLLWNCQFDGFEVVQQFPKCIEMKTLNERKVCKCSVTAYTAAAVWVKPTSFGGGGLCVCVCWGGYYTTDESWHRVLDEALLIKSMLSAVTVAVWPFLLFAIGLYWFCCAVMLTNQLQVFESIFMISSEQKV